LLTFKVEKFEGPLDLLLKLIHKNKVDIYDIPISLITKQFIDEVDKMDKNPETIGDFIVMTAELVDIKSRMLLPSKEDDRKDDADPRAELVKRLIEYKKFRNAADELKQKEELADEEIFRQEDSEIMDGIRQIAPPDINELLDGVTIEYLYDIFEGILKRAENKKAEKKPEVREIKKAVYNIRDKMQYIKDLIFIQKRLVFSEIFRADTSKTEIIVTFLAVLELVKEKFLSVIQQNSEIFITEGISYGNE
jgi:segregation and condensation protein A